MTRFVLHTRQRGVAVITALLLTTLAITLVASLFWQQQVQVRSIENQRLQLQKRWVLRGALDWARLILREDARSSSVDFLEEPWAVPLADTRLDQYVENNRTDTEASDASVSGNVVDAQSRFNLSNLCPAEVINPAEVAAFGRLLGNLRINPALAQATADMMAATKSKQTDAAATSAKPMTLQHIEDLLAVPGFTADMLAAVKDFVVVLPGIRTVNVNTAPAEVLAARIGTLSLTDAAAIVASRRGGNYFKDVADLDNRFPGKSIAAAGNDLSVRTDFFIVYGRVRLSNATLEVASLIERQPVAPFTKILWIRES